MVEAMVVHEYEGDTCKGKDCGLPQADAYNVVVSVDLGGGRRSCIHALVDGDVEAGSLGRELLEGAALLLGARSDAGSAGGAVAASAALPGGGAPRRARARPFGVHKHSAVGSGACDGGTHHVSCDSLFPNYAEMSCSPVTPSDPPRWNCIHSEIPDEE